MIPHEIVRRKLRYDHMLHGSWSDDCKATLKDVDDHVSAIFEKCQNLSNDKVGGKVAFVNEKCGAQIQIIKTSGQPPQGNLS